jgi:hypothetical protein
MSISGPPSIGPHAVATPKTALQTPSRALPHPKEVCFLAGLPVGAVGELDHTDIPLAGNVRGVEFTARGTGTPTNYRPGVDSTVDSRLTAVPPDPSNARARFGRVGEGVSDDGQRAGADQRRIESLQDPR